MFAIQFFVEKEYENNPLVLKWPVVPRLGESVIMPPDDKFPVPQYFDVTAVIYQPSLSGGELGITVHLKIPQAARG
jgi:hypothetical protein